MTSTRKTYPLDALVSPRFAQLGTFARLPYQRELQDIDVAFIGIPFDGGTTFRTGARMGPQAVRESSRLLRPYHLFLDVSPFDVFNVVDYGDVDVVPGSFQDTAEAISRTLRPLLARRIVPLVCGGDHSITLPVLRELARVHGPLNLIHFDSHFDFWDTYWGQKYTHGTWLRRCLEEGLLHRVAQAGIRGSQFSPDDLAYAAEHNIVVKTIKDFHDHGVFAALGSILETLPANEPLYVSWDIDVVDPAYAMATGTPEVGGLTSWQALECLRALVGKRLVGLDIVEVAPPYDAPGAPTSLLAANLFYEGISVLAKNYEQGMCVYLNLQE
ncbi:MAG: agmatinase [Firmicutes bacterium]|nr:agmatinase [Bacillota bacterium]